MSTDKVRVPKQKRSIEVKNKIKTAALELFSEKGYHNTSTNEIAKKAGVSIGSLYSYFVDKKAIFIETLHEYNQNVVGQVSVVHLNSETDMPDLISNYIYAVLEAHKYSPEFHREILAMTYSHEDVREIISHYEDRMIAQIEELLRLNEERTDVTDLKSAAYIIFKSVEEVVHGIKVFSRPCNENILVSELTTMICGYVMK
ncbi:MAG: TetR/AcrR family transcriptional regulator [Spirochaetales bacterium]|nr:TetR/AcrR family transcriptional regulator [Spirochaetales bacterium]